MNQKICAYCGASLHEEASFCHDCESVQTERVKPVVICPIGRNLRLLLLANVLALIALLIALLYPILFPSQPDQPIADEEPLTQPAESSFQTEYCNDHEAIYTEDGVSYRVGVSFGDFPTFDAAGAYYTATIGAMDGYVKWTHLFVVRESDGAVMQAEFASMVRSAYVEICDAVSGERFGVNYAETVDPKMHLSALQVGIEFDAYSGKRDLVWHIRMNSGEELVFRQTMEIFRTAQVVYTAENASMNTIEELRSLIAHIEATEEMETEVLIYLPAVVYEGGLQLGRSYSIYGSTDGGVTTTFTDTVVCAAPEPYIMRFTDIVFEGRGSGVGVEDHCGTELHRCTLRNWDVAAKTGDTGWILSFSSVYADNGTGIEFNSLYSWYNISEYYDNVFEGNDTALVINQISPIRALQFPGCVFRGNGKIIVNHTTQSVDLSAAVVE